MAADARAALAALAEGSRGQFQGRDAAFRLCIQRRFSDAAPEANASVEDMFVRHLLLAYHTYWWSAVREAGNRDVAERRLTERLAALIGEPIPSGPDAIDALAERYAQELQNGQLHSWVGTT